MPIPPALHFDELIVRGLDKVREKFALQETADINSLRMVIFSDHHRGAKTGADDFADCEEAYRAALEHYLAENFRLVLLGDVEELWECSPHSVIAAYEETLRLEQMFHRAGGYTRIYGNHDDVWTTTWQMKMHLERYICDDSGRGVILEALSLALTDGHRQLGELFLTHGHQGTPDSDRFAPFSRFVVRYLWRPLQRLLKIRSNTPSQDYDLRMKHELSMSRWAAAQDKLVLITGHTHHPVFPQRHTADQTVQRLRELRARSEKRGLAPEERMRLKDETGLLEAAVRMQEHHPQPPDTPAPRPCYFNAGCCSFADGDITGLEIADGEIRLVRWSTLVTDQVARHVVRQLPLKELFSET
ncbi:MAG: UDP-2,3-diacylglucosamine pyrophosphatase LpxH [Verrucomicrobiales bacterium]|jgi:UDP-2,3-diacylglucosamine pyrophosphatase LpxH